MTATINPTSINWQPFQNIEFATVTVENGAELLEVHLTKRGDQIEVNGIDIVDSEDASVTYPAHEGKRAQLEIVGYKRHDYYYYIPQ